MSGTEDTYKSGAESDIDWQLKAVGKEAFLARSFVSSEDDSSKYLHVIIAKGKKGKRREPRLESIKTNSAKIWRRSS